MSKRTIFRDGRERGARRGVGPDAGRGDSSKERSGTSDVTRKSPQCFIYGGV